jgi:mannose-6-phosphate isomerase
MTQKALYPLKFKTIFKDKIWGGNKIKSLLGKDYGDLPNCGETWEISGVPGDISLVKEGDLEGESLVSLIDKYQGALLGDQVYKKFGNQFPLLIKFIDANDDLSVQVHPDDTVARLKHNSFGKTEMWYVLQADNGSSLISGFNRTVDREEYLGKFRAGQLMDILNREEVNANDVFFLPAGRVHTIGKGLLIAEIQQTSDVTYRIYDFDRVDAKGNSRELHFDEALEVMDFQKHEQYKTSYQDLLNEKQLLVTNQYFHTSKLNITEKFMVDLKAVDSFKIYICVEGSVVLQYGDKSCDLQKGEVVLLPANMKSFELIPTTQKASLLETYVP